MLELKNLSKIYDNFHAVKNLNLTVKKGEIYGFLGINGAGKTSTLRMITGITLPSSGTVIINGFDILKNPQEAKQITGYIPDRPHLYGKLKAREMLQFVAALYNSPKDISEPRIDSLLSEYGLVDKQHQLIESFSHGMKQRLTTCVALIHNPQLLVIDEPMVGLDPHGAKLLKAKFKEYKNAGITILLSTHSLNVAEEVCDRLAIIQKGTILVEGTYKDILSLTSQRHDNLEKAFLEITQEATTYQSL
jgi:ABC-2 type transport system ATP-binding protein